MHTLSTALRRALGMTEKAAYDAYRSHVDMCSQCSPQRSARCPRAVKLHDAWKRAEAQQHAQPAGSGRR